MPLSHPKGSTTTKLADDSEAMPIDHTFTNFKVFHNNSSPYICELLLWCIPARALRFASTASLYYSLVPIVAEQFDMVDALLVYRWQLYKMNCLTILSV